MSYVYRQQHVSSTKYSIKSPFTMSAQYITIHNTYNDASAKNEATYHNSNTNQVSFHIAIDDFEAVEVVPLNRNAWHCGDGAGNGNRKSIGIEICYSKSGGERYLKAEENAVQLTAQMLLERGWGIDRVKKHQDWSGKYCPHRILDAHNGWNNFLNRVSNRLNELKNPNTNKGELTLSQYNELLGYIKNLENKVAQLEGKLGVTPSAPTPQPVPVAPPTQPTTVVKKLKLPASATSWSVYPLGKAPVKANAVGTLNPNKFGGLTYDILGNPQTDVYTIQTSNFGKVNIYAAKSTGATIV